MAGWFDDIDTPEPQPKTPEPECQHEWVPAPFTIDLDECLNCLATREGNTHA